MVTVETLNASSLISDDGTPALYLQGGTRQVSAYNALTGLPDFTNNTLGLLDSKGVVVLKPCPAANITVNGVVYATVLELCNALDAIFFLSSASSTIGFEVDPPLVISGDKKKLSVSPATTTSSGVAALQVDLSDTTSTTKAATPSYVDGLIKKTLINPNILQPAYGASTSNIALTGSVTYKGLKIPAGSRWLATGQTDTKANGLYITNDSGAWTRATDADTAAELFIAQITALNGDAGLYLCTIPSTAVVGTDPITFILQNPANTEFVGVQLYNPAVVYPANTLVVNPSASEYIWRCLIGGTNNITPSMASPNWEIYEGLLYQNSAVVAPNGDDTKSAGFPYATFSGAIADLSTGAYIEGRAVTVVEAITPKAGMLIVGNNSQVSKATISADNVTISGLNLAGTAANPVPISVVGCAGSRIQNLTATANASSNSIEFTGAWSGVHRLSGLQLSGNISIAGTTTSGIILISDVLSTVTLTLNCANARVYIQNCPNMVLVETAGDIISDQNSNVVYVAPTGLATNNGLSYYTAVPTLAAAAAIAGNGGRQIVVFPGIYPEISTITNQNISITSLNQEEGGLVSFTGAITFNPAASSVRVSGVTFATLNKQGAGSLQLENCKINTAFTDSGSGYIQLDRTDTQGASLTGVVSITGSGVKNFYTDCTTGFMTINNATAAVTIARNLTVAPVLLLAGILAVGGGNAMYATNTVLGSTTNGSTTISGITLNTALLRVGATISGAGIPAGATIATIVSANSITISAAATATASNVVLTTNSYALSATGGTLQIDGATFLTPSGSYSPINVGAGVNYVIKYGSRDLATTTISSSAIPIPSSLVIDAQTDRFAVVTTSANIPFNQELTLVNSATATTQTLPNAVLAAGRLFKIRNIGAGLATIAGISPNVTVQQGQTGLFESNGATWYQLNAITQLRSVATQALNFNAVSFTNTPVDTRDITFTANRTNGNTTISNISVNTNLLQVGTSITGTGIPAGATIATIVSANSITISSAATSTGTAGSLTVKNTITSTLPATPADGTVIAFNDANGSFHLNNFTIARNGATINGLSLDWICKVPGGVYQATYNSTANNWLLVETSGRSAYTQVSGNYQATIFDRVIEVVSSTPVAVTLPATILPGAVITIKNSNTTAVEVNVIGQTDIATLISGVSTTIIPRPKDAVTLIGNQLGNQWLAHSSATVYSRVNGQSSNAGVTLSASITPVSIGLSVTLPYPGTYRVSYSVCSFQRTSNGYLAQNGTNIVLRNTTTGSDITNSVRVASSTDQEVDTGVGMSDAGTASGNFIITTTTVNNIIQLFAYLNALNNIVSWETNQSNLTYELMYI